MSPAKIYGEQQNVDMVFSNKYLFRVPDFQRPYGWTTKQAGELLDDLLDFVTEGKEVNELDPYFLGSIVLIKDEDAPDAKVVDGQQRLTTLTILLAALRGLSQPEFAEGLKNRIFQEGDVLTGKPGSYRLTLRNRDKEFFRKYVQDEGGLEKLRKLEATLSDSQERIRDNSRYYLSRLEALPEDRREQLARFIISGCYLVVVSTSDDDSAHRIFSVLNSRGLDLSLTDILKADVIGAVPVAEQEDYSDRWEELEERLGRTAFQDLFSHIRMIYVKAKSRGAILKELREDVKPEKDPQAFMDEVLSPMADAYGDILQASYSSASHADEINELLRWLNQIARFNDFDWQPPAILYTSRHRNDPNDLLRFLRDLERLASGLMILRANSTIRIGRYGRLISSIEKGEALYQETSPLQLTPEEREEIVARLNGDIYNTVQIRLPVLLRLDSVLSAGGVVHNRSIISVEHILPQNPHKDSEWVSLFPDEEQRSNLVHRLGNLALLPRRKNAQAQNFDFEKKKRAYFQREGVANFAITNQVLAYKSWTPEVVEKRQAELVNMLKTVWRL